MPTLRDYQQEDFNCVLMAHERHQSVIGRAATGLGKAVLSAALAVHYQRVGRVLILVDVRKLARQLADTYTWFAGMRPGIEMGNERVDHECAVFAPDPVVISTVQTQYSGDAGSERYRKFDPTGFAAVLLDECELFLAPKALEVVRYYMNGNPKLKVFGCSATPFRMDGVEMSELFQAIGFDRDILWGIEQGWLVRARQAFVRVTIDFSTLRVRKRDDGEDDYSDADIAERINNEQTLIELAKGITHVAGDRRSIVICPDVESAKAVAHYLEGERPGCARCVYGLLDDADKDDAMSAHQRGEFQFLTSVNMLTKGYDDPGCVCVFVCRKTRSRRLYQQIVGRVLRPARAIAGELGTRATNAERRGLIAASDKPEAMVVNMVGIDDDVRDMTVANILGVAKDDAVVERANQLQLDAEHDGKPLSPESALEQAEAEIEEEREAALMAAEAEAERLDNDDAEREARRRVDVKASVDVEYEDGLMVGGGEWSAPVATVDPKHLNILRKARLTESEIARLSADEAKALSRKIVARWKTGMCSYRQAKILQKNGYAKEQIAGMKFEEASIAIDRIFNRRSEVA